jgi:ABC-type lipoprotein release transport system permease subunit
VARFHRIRASRVTVEIVSWTIGILLMVGLTVLVVILARHLGWSWP